MMRAERLWVLVGAAVALAAVAVLIVRHASAPDDAVPNLRDPARIAAGKPLYDAHCAACHGPDLEGQPNWKVRLPSGRLPAPPHDDSGHTWHHPNAMLFAVTKNGMKPPIVPADYESDMPGFGGTLSDEQIWNVLAYIQSRWSERVRKAHAELDARPAR
jgi:mono/diheme cytochrome c family protein